MPKFGVDAADAFMHTPLLAPGAFAYLPPLPSAEGLAYLEQLQPVVNLRAHCPVVIARPLELSTNKPGEISPNSIKIDNYDEMTNHAIVISRYDTKSACMRHGMMWQWRDMA